MTEFPDGLNQEAKDEGSGISEVDLSYQYALLQYSLCLW